MTLKNAVKKVISQNYSLGYHPEIFIVITKNGEAENLELLISDLVKNKNTEEEVVNAIKRYGEVLTVEDFIDNDEYDFGLPQDVLEEAKRRKKVYNWYRKFKK
jgi:hypothetical protein